MRRGILGSASAFKGANRSDLVETANVSCHQGDTPQEETAESGRGAKPPTHIDESEPDAKTSRAREFQPMTSRELRSTPSGYA